MSRKKLFVRGISIALSALMIVNSSSVLTFANLPAYAYAEEILETESEKEFLATPLVGESAGQKFADEKTEATPQVEESTGEKLLKEQKEEVPQGEEFAEEDIGKEKTKNDTGVEAAGDGDLVEATLVGKDSLEVTDVGDKAKLLSMSSQAASTHIVAIENPEKQVYEYEYKPWLQTILDELPHSLIATLASTEDVLEESRNNLSATIAGVEDTDGDPSTAHTQELGTEGTDDSLISPLLQREIPVEGWECVEDYDENLGTYHFIPVITEPIEDEGVQLPQVEVRCEHEGAGAVGPVSYEHGSAPLVKGDELLCAEGMESYYNLYEKGGRLPAIRDQNPWGTCWAHSALGCIETDLITDNPGLLNVVDLSERHLAYFTYNSIEDPKGLREEYASYPGYMNRGGNNNDANRTMLAGIGPVEEKVAPYKQEINPSINLAYENNYAQIRRAYEIDYSQRDLIKKAIKEHGGVGASYYDAEGEAFYTNGEKAGEAYYSSTNNCFYGNIPGTNHAIMLVGWDDNFSRNNFKGIQPSSDGAWLVRNSWGGRGYSHYAYFWISYEDAGLISSGVVYAYDADFDTYGHVYGTTEITGGGWYFLESGSVTQRKSLIIDGGEKVEAIGWSAGAANAYCEITIDDGINTIHKNVATTYGGYYVEPLDTPILCIDDTPITITVKITVPSDEYIKVEDNLMIRAYTNDANVIKKKIELTETSLSGHRGETAQISLTEASDVSMDELTWVSGDEDIASVDQNGLITFNGKKGETAITGIYSENGQRVICAASVIPYSISYAFDEDTVSLIEIDSYYPGDAENCILPEVGSPYSTYYYQSAYKKGYYLAGWYLDSDLSQEVNLENLIDMSGDLVLYPKWTPLRYYLNCFYIDEYGVADASYYGSLCDFYINDLPLELLKDSNIMYNCDNLLWQYNYQRANQGLAPVAPVGFSLNADGSDSFDVIREEDLEFYYYNWMAEEYGQEYADTYGKRYSCYMQSNSIELHMIYDTKYRINYNLHGGINNPKNPDYYNAGDSSISLYAPVRDGYTFVGWKIREGGYLGGTITNIDTSQNKPVEVDAIWKCDSLKPGEAYGICGADAEWFLTADGRLTISGTGTISSSGSPFDAICGKITDVIIEDGIKEIGAYTFSGCENITSVDIGRTVTWINTSAFGDAKKLTYIYIPQSVECVGSDIFYHSPRMLIECGISSSSNSSSWCPDGWNYGWNEYYDYSLGRWAKHDVRWGVEDPRTATDVTVNSARLSIGEKIDGCLNLIFELDIPDTLENGYVTVNDLRYDFTESGLMDVSYPVAAKDIFDKVQLKVYKASGQNVRIKKTSGELCPDHTLLYSVGDYCEAVKNQTDSSASLKKLMDSVLTYGDAAAYYFGKKVAADRTPTVDGSVYDITKYAETINKANLPNSATYLGTSLILDSGVKMRHYFTKDIGAYTFTNSNGETIKSGTAAICAQTPAAGKSGVYYVETDSIAISEIDRAVTLKGATGSVLIRYYPFTYGSKVMKTDKVSLQNVMRAMYQLNRDTLAYFG